MGGKSNFPEIRLWIFSIIFVTKMPRKKLSDCSESVKLMRILKARLIEISLKVDNYIYKQKPISELQAKAFLDEISSYKSHCQNDIGYLQVIEKLTRYMNIIISNNTNKTRVNDVNSNGEIIEVSNNTTLSSKNGNFTTDIVSPIINKESTENSWKNKNKLGLTLYNEPTSDTEALSKDNYEINKKNYKKVEKKSIIKETVDLENGAETKISSKVMGNDARDKSNNNTNKTHTASIEHGSGDDKNNDKAATNNDKTLRIKKRVQSSLKQDYRLLICVDSGVINDISHLSNTTVIHRAPEVNIPLNAFVLNNAKMHNTSCKTHPKVIENNLTNKSGKEPKNVPVNNKPRVKKNNNKNIKFTAPFIDLTENARPIKKKLDEENNKQILTSNLTTNNSETNILSKKQRTIKKDATKNKKRNKVKESRRISDNKSQHQTIERKVNECKSIDQSILPKEVKLNSNDLKAQDDLSWFDSIKFVRKIDEQEYFKPEQPLDDNFWHNPSFTSNEREFNIQGCKN